MRTRHLIILILACLFQIQFVFSQTNKLYIPPTDCPFGKTTNVEMQMDNQSEIVALQFNLHIPDVVTLDQSGIQLTEERKDDHKLSVTNKGDNNYLVVVLSINNKAFKNASGSLIKIPLVVPDGLEIEKEHPFQLTNVVLSDRNGKNVMTSFDAGMIKIVDGNGPDITPTNIRLSSDDFKPGGKVSLTWNVENIGGKPTEDGGWSEQLYLVDESGNEYPLGSGRCEEIIPSKGTVSRQAEYTIDDYPGIEGKVKAKVILTAFSGWELPAYRENNEGMSDAGLDMPKVLTLRINATSIREQDTHDIFCFLNRSGSRKMEETFTIQNSNTNRLELPTLVTIPTNESGVSLVLKTKNDEIANKDSFAIVTISGNGYTELEQEIWIKDDETPALAITAPNETQQEGQTFNLMISRPWETKWPLTVKLATDHPKRFSFDAEVTIPANASSVTVPVQTINDDKPDVPIDAVFMVSKSGYETGRGFVKLEDDDVPDITLDITPATFAEGAGAQAAIATLRRTKVTNNKITVKLTDTSKGMLYYPTSSITLDTGETEYQFAIGVSDNELQDGDRTVQLTAAVYISSCSCSTAGTSAGTVTKDIVITDNDGPTLKIVSSQSALIEGKKEATQLTITRNTSTDQALTVSLSCDLPNDVILPSSVTIPAGKASVTIPVEAKSNETTEGNRTIAFIVKAEGFSSGTCWAMITDQTLPDAVVDITSLSINKLNANGMLKVDVSVSNVGNTDLPTGMEIAFYLASSPTLKSSSYKELINGITTSEVIKINRSKQFSSWLTLPDRTGEYYLIAAINESQHIPELVYINNYSDGHAIILDPLYTVSVSVSKETYKLGEPIVIKGQVSGASVANVPVELYIINDNIKETINVTTNSTGAFTHIFSPKSYQIGHFKIGACYPGEGLNEEMAFFDIYGLKLVSTSPIKHDIKVNQTYQGSIKLLNPGLGLTNIQAEVISSPKGCSIQIEPLASLATNDVGVLNYTVSGITPSSTSSWDYIKLRIYTNEGAESNVTLYYYCSSDKGELVSDISSVKTTMTKGLEREYRIMITNKGKGETGKISISLPTNTPWLQLLSPQEIPSLNYGDEALVSLSLKPTEDLLLNVPLQGTLSISCASGKGMTIPFNITPVSESTGTLVVDVCDEYTYNTVEAPHVAGAKVRVTTPANALVAEGLTNSKGQFIIENLAEGYYIVEVSEDHHSDTFKGKLVVDPGQTTTQIVNLSFQAIQVSWNVEETIVEDEYEIVTEVQFQTNVPVPVVELNIPSNIPATDLKPGESLMFYATLTNKGLITAEDVQLLLPTGFKSLIFEPLLHGPFNLTAQSSITIPVKVTKKQTTLRSNLDNDPCVGYPGTLYFWDCGTDRKWHRYEAVLQLGPCKNGELSKTETGAGSVVGWGGGFGGPGNNGWFSGGSAPSYEPVKINIPEFKIEDKGCEPCQNKFLLDLIQCYKPIKIAFEVADIIGKSYKCIGSFTAENSSNIDKLKNCPFTADIGKSLQEMKEIINLYNYLIHKISSGQELTPVEKEMIIKDFQETAVSAIKDIVNAYVGNDKNEVQKLAFEVIDASKELGEAVKQLYGVINPESDNVDTPSINKAQLMKAAQNFFAKLIELFGKMEGTKLVAEKGKEFLEVWKKFDCITPLLEPCDKIEPVPDKASLRSTSKDYPSYIQSFQKTLRVVQEGALAEDQLRMEIMGDPIWGTVTKDELWPLFEYLNEFTADLKTDQGVYLLKPNAVSDKQMQRLVERWYNSFGIKDFNKENSIDCQKIEELYAIITQSVQYLEKSGYTSFKDLLEAEFSVVESNLNKSQQSVCSSVSLQFSQTMTMTRQAFRGTLAIYNGHDTEAMHNVRLNLEVKDDEGNVATSNEFQIKTEKLDVFTGDLERDNWSLNAQKTGTATILFIPSKYAAPTEPKDYSFGGTLSYIDPFTGLEVTRDLFPVTLTVNPSPNLKLTYFVQRNILGDDPLTTNKVEPSVPAEFSLLIQNTGAGDATNVNMVTNQPEIVDNEKKLAIDFELLNSVLNGKEKSLALGGSVATNFGTIPAGQTAYAQWWFTSTLLGNFTKYKVEATHVTSYDNPNLSLLDGAPTIHELIRSIKVTGSDLTGFLVNDLVDVEDTPDMIYLTDGTIATVSKASAKIEKNGDQYTLTVTPSAKGWSYGSLTDPTGGRQKLVSITRQDGQKIDLQNIWQTSCTVRNGKAIYENRIHFADKINGNTTYQLTFEPGPDVILEVASYEGILDNNEVAEKPITEITVHFNKAIEPETFTTEDLTLVLQGQQRDVSSIHIAQKDKQTFILDLTEVSKLDGFYVLTVQTAGITDHEGFQGESGKSVSWTQYLAPGYQTLSMELASGWNWISTNMAGVSNPVSLLAPVKEKTKRMQSQSQEVTNDPQLGLVGNLEKVAPETFYKLEMNANGKIDITGTVLTPNQVEIDLKAGWNWIGYIPRSATTTTKALALLTANVGDEVKGQAGFAQFNGSVWVGTLDKMEPGKGYMYKAAKAQTFQYPIVSPLDATVSLRSVDLRSDLKSPWTVNIHKYPNNMSIVANLWLDKVKQEPDQYVVAAFCGDECRGIGKYVDGKLFITVYGDKAGENITFRAVLNGGTSQWKIKETISFSETTQGTLAEPFDLHLSEQVTGNDVILTQNGIYPNPVSRLLFIKGDTQDIRRIQVVGGNGAVLMNQGLNGGNSIDVSPLSAGLYILIIERDNESELHKFIKK